MSSSLPPDQFVAEADVSSKRGISIVWLVPLVALVIGAWLTYKAYSEKGPTITVSFEEAAGVAAGKTIVRYRDVDIGVVTAVRLTDDLEGVTITAALDKGTERLLGKNTRFWVAQPEVSITGVRGLQTILSGVYLGIDPDTQGAPQRRFVGLENQPFITDDRGGRYFNLTAPNRASLAHGAPIMRQGFIVGEVVDLELDAENALVNIRIFVEAPHYQQITPQTRFWDISGFDLELSADGLKIDTRSLVSILIGGITFGSLNDSDGAKPAPEDSEYTLFATRKEAFRPTYRKRRMIVYFDESVRGLTAGAPVEFRGAKMGEVVDIRAQYDADNFTFRIPVFIDIEPERFEIIGTVDSSPETREANLQGFIDRGLRAQLKTGSLVTGKKLIEFMIIPDAEQAELVFENGMPVVPTVPTVLDSMTQKVAGILEKLERLPIEEISQHLLGTTRRVRQLVEEADVEQAIESLAGALDQAQELLAGMNQDVVPPFTATVENAEQFSRSMATEISPQLSETLRELRDAARSIRVMTDYLERHPDALIKGKN